MMEGGGGGRRAAAGPPPLPLPPGFRFRPTDEELLTHYLAPKVADAGFAPAALREVDLYKAEPWDLLPAGSGGGGEDGGGYFFCRRSVKFPSGLRSNRATRAGYWKSTGKDRVVVAASRARGDCPLGVRKTLVFYRGRAPTGHKTSWVMHEYRLLHTHGYTSSPVHAAAGAQQSEWVICRMFMKKAPGEASQPEQAEAVLHLHPPLGDHVLQPPVDGCGGKTAAPPAVAASDDSDQHANCFSNTALAMAPGDSNVDWIESMLQLNRHGHEEELWMNYPESSSTYPHVAASTSAKAAVGLRDELAADCFDLLPQLLDYEALSFLQDF